MTPDKKYIAIGRYFATISANSIAEACMAFMDAVMEDEASFNSTRDPILVPSIGASGTIDVDASLRFKDVKLVHAVCSNQERTEEDIKLIKDSISKMVSHAQSELFGHVAHDVGYEPAEDAQTLQDLSVMMCDQRRVVIKQLLVASPIDQLLSMVKQLVSGGDDSADGDKDDTLRTHEIDPINLVPGPSTAQ